MGRLSKTEAAGLRARHSGLTLRIVWGLAWLKTWAGLNRLDTMDSLAWDYDQLFRPERLEARQYAGLIVGYDTRKGWSLDPQKGGRR